MRVLEKVREKCVKKKRKGKGEKKGEKRKGKGEGGVSETTEKADGGIVNGRVGIVGLLD